MGAAEVQVGLVGRWGVEEGDVLALVPVKRELQLADHQQENLSKERAKKHAIIKCQISSLRGLAQLTSLQTTQKPLETHIHKLYKSSGTTEAHQQHLCRQHSLPASSLLMDAGLNPPFRGVKAKEN